MRQFKGISAKCPKEHQFWGAEAPLLLGGCRVSGRMSRSTAPTVRAPEPPALMARGSNAAIIAKALASLAMTFICSPVGRTVSTLGRN